MNLRQALAAWVAFKQAIEGERPLVWFSRGAAYYYQDNGQPVGDRRIDLTWDRYLGQVQRNVDGHTQALLSGRIDVAQYRDLLRGETRDAYRIGYMTGRGGRQQMTRDNWLEVGRHIHQQNQYIDKFCRQLQAGQAGSPAQIQARARLYAQQPYSMASAGRRAGKQAAGFGREKRVAILDKNTCGECARLAGLGWQPLGSLPLPGEGTPCASNCRCSLVYDSPPPMTEEEAAELLGKVEREYAEWGETGFTYNPLTGEHESSGFALSIYKEREAVLPLDGLTRADLIEFARQNADLLQDQSKFPHRIGGWARQGDLFLDVSMCIPSEQLLRAAEYVVKYNQLAMFDLSAMEEVNRAHCVQILKDAGRLPADWTDPYEG